MKSPAGLCITTDYIISSSFSQGGPNGLLHTAPVRAGFETAYICSSSCIPQGCTILVCVGPGNEWELAVLDARRIEPYVEADMHVSSREV